MVFKKKIPIRVPKIAKASLVRPEFFWTQQNRLHDSHVNVLSKVQADPLGGSVSKPKEHRL